MSVLRKFLGKQLDNELSVLLPRLKFVVADVCEDRRYAVDLVLKDGNLSLRAINTLQLVQSVLDYTNSDLDICAWIFDELKVTSLEGLASALYPRSELEERIKTKPNSAPKALTAQSLGKIYSKFFNQEQLRVILVLFRGGRFLTPNLDKEVVETVLSFLIQNGINVNDARSSEKLAKRFATGNEGKQPSSNDLASSLEFVKTVILLCRVVGDPEDVPLLLKAGFVTVRQITQSLKGNFRDQMVSVGMKSENSLRVHDCAERLDCWNEQLWLSLMQSRREDFIPISNTSPNGTNSGKPSGRPLNNLTDLFKLEDAACEECCSVTGLSAYLADLLLLLRSTVFPAPSPEDINGSTNYTDGEGGERPKNLLDVLFQRRPDIKKLQLTCTNSQTLLPYLALVNEVLESYARSIAQPPIAPSDRYEDSIRAYQTPPGFEEGGGSATAGIQYRPANTDYSVYRKLVSKAMFPFTCFPYDLSRDLETSVFSTYGVDFSRLVRLFQSPEYLLSLVPRDRRGQPGDELYEGLVNSAKETLERQFAAEILGLQQTEFAAITSETFFPSAFADLVNGLSPNKLEIDKACLAEASELWGFEDDDELLDPEKGLSLIKNQLMAKSGLEFEDILGLVKARCFGQHLVITNASGSQQFGTLIEGLRLLSNASAPPFQPLTSELAFGLQTFLRLKAKLKWRLSDIDAAVVSFRNLELSTMSRVQRPARSLLPVLANGSDENVNDRSLIRPVKEWEANPSEIVSISPFVIKGISCLIRLSKLSGIEPAKLIPLWAPIDTYGDNSLFHREFMTGKLQQIDGIFALYGNKEDGSGQYLTLEGEPAIVDDHSRGICAALRWQPAYFDQLMSVANCRGKRLDIDSFSSLYRFATICSILAVPPKYCVEFFDVFFSQSNGFVLSDPLSTVSAIENWKLLLDSGWVIESLIDVLGKGRQYALKETGENNEAGLRFALDITRGAKDLGDSVPVARTSAIPTAADVVDYASRAFDASTAKIVVDLVENSKALPEVLFVKYPLLKELSLALEQSEKPDIKTASSQATNGEKSSSKDADSVVSAAAETEKHAEEQESLEAMIRLRNRRSTFVKLVGPLITEDLFRVFLVKSVQELLPDLDPSVVLILVSDIVSVPTLDSNSRQSALSALQEIKVLVSNSPSTETLDAYFSPPLSDNYILNYTGSSSYGIVLPTLSINDLDIPYDSDSKSFTSFRLAAGKSYHVKSNFSGKDVNWSTSKSDSVPFTTSTLISASVANRTASIIGAIKRTANLCKAEQLTPEELQFIALNKTDKNLAFDLNELSLSDLVQLSKYSELRKRASGEPRSLIGLITWLSVTSSVDQLDAIAEKISDATGWSQPRVLEALKATFVGYSTVEVLRALNNLDTFLRFTDFMGFNDELENACTGGSLPSMSTLFDLAKPRLSLNVSENDLNKAIDLQGGLTVSQKADLDAVLSSKRRDVMIQYLLQQETVRDELKIHDADGLFERLLIDVQMGPQLRTSRVKQAISVAQLFIQRCLLGMEKGVSKNMIARNKWSWMQHYTLWEAHRKVFLYPENWLEPSLRDDKSQLFEQLEAVLMQKDLSISTFLRAIQDYIYDLNGIASLDIVSYLHEPHEGAEDIFHLFGRTRTAPHTFYYRTLTIYYADHSVFWQPWTKVELDIPSVESDWDSKRLHDSGAYLLPILQQNRLYIFFPQIMVKTVNTSQSVISKTEEKRQTWTDLGNTAVGGQEPRTSWEITMAWSEYVKGTWSPKRISPGSLNIDAAQIPQQEKLPSASQFRIDSIFETDRFRIVLSYAPETDLAGKIVGSFDFSRDQVTASQSPDINMTASQFSTHFGKARGENSTLFIPGVNDDKTKPLVWLPANIGRPKEDVKWTLSKTPNRTTGLVLNARQQDGSSISYFNVPEKELLATQWTQERIVSRMSLKALDHSFSQSLMQAAASRVEPLEKIYNTVSATPNTELPDSFGLVGLDTFYHELASPCGLYNWEIGVHSIMLAVDRFLATQQFDEALQVARLLFDPTVDMDVRRDTNAGSRPPTKSCWRFPPFQDISEIIDDSGDKPPNLNKLGAELQLAINDRRSYGQLVHAAARGRPQAYMKWIVMKYAEILLAAGDEYFRKGTLESLPLAIQRYIEAAHVLGPEPIKGLKVSKRTPLCFDDVIKDEVRMNLALPFSAQLRRGNPQGKGSASTSETDPKKETVRSFIMTSYFGVPLNPKFKALRSRVHERLYNIRNSLDINGKPIVYALREPPIDPAALVALGGAVGTHNDLAIVLGDQNGPLTRYRFEMRLSKAFELCIELRSLAERFISAVEKKESEELNVLRSRNATVIQDLMLRIKATQLLEAQQTLESLNMSRDAQVAQLSFFLETIGESTSIVPSSTQEWSDLEQDIGPITKDDMRMSAYEKSEMDLAGAAASLNIIAAGIDHTAQAFAWLPSISGNMAPFGVGCSISAGGSNIAGAIQIAAMSMKADAMIVSESSNQAGRKARMAKQLQERRLQANIKGREIKATDKQIEIQRIRIAAAENEIESQKASLADAAQAESYLRSKYTNQQLYGWMEKGLRNLYFQAYTLAATAAQQAEAALSFQQGRRVSILKPSGYWDASRDGLLAADHLYLDLKRLESAHLETKTWDYEITKTFSLRQIDPLALLKLRVTGSTDFSLPEHQYDMDFPGHYMRRIRSIAVSIPAIIGPHTGLNANLTLTKHQYRINSTATNGKDYLSTSVEDFREDAVPISSVAISSGLNDTGVFELNFAGTKYLPFEGAGAISSWRLRLPTEIRKFDYETISDVLLHVQYTSLEGGECLRASADESVRLIAQSVEAKGTSEGFYALFDLKNDFPNEWYGFNSRLLSSCKATKAAAATMELDSLKNRLPFWSRSREKLVVKSVALMSRSAKLVRGMSIPAATGDGPIVDEGRLGDGKSAFTMKTFSDLSQQQLNGWVLEASGAVVGEEEQQLENVYMLIRYVFG